MAASITRRATSSVGGTSSTGYNLASSASGARSPSSSVCSFAGSVNSDSMYQQNKYLMKTLCLSKKSPSLPGKAEYANLLTCGLGARKWLASLDFDAENFKVAIINIYPRLASVPQYSLWNVKADKTLEKLPCMVNTPKRIKAYLGPTFTGSLVIMPSEEISLGPVKVPPIARNFGTVNGTSTSSNRSSRCSSTVKDEKESGYESNTNTLYQEFPNASESGRSREGRDREREHRYESTTTTSTPNHKILHNPTTNPAPAGNRATRLICLSCGRLAKQVGSTAFYDINNPSTFTTTDGYISIAKKLKELFHLELPRSKIIPSDQICRKCFRALNEIHFLETQLKRSKEEMMATLFSTVSKISRLEQMAREASSSSSSESTHSTLSTLMASSGLNPWIQEARYAHALEHKHRPDGHRRSEHPPPPSVVGSVRQGPNPADQGAQGPAPITSTSTAQPTAVAIFQSTSPDGEGRFVDYNSPQPVFLAPLAGFAPQGSPGKFNFEKHDAVYAKRQSATMVPLNMSILSTAASVHSAQQNRHSPRNNDEGPNNTSNNPPTSSSATTAIYLGKSAGPIFFANPATEPRGPASSAASEAGSSRGGEIHREDPLTHARNQAASLSAEEEMEKQMAEEEENAAQEAAEREHAATAFLEEAYRRRNQHSGSVRGGPSDREIKVSSGNENGGGTGSCSSRSGSVMGVNSGPSSSPGSQSPSPPVSAMQPSVLNHPLTSRINPDPDSKSNSSNGSRSPTDAITMRKPWKKRHYEVVDQDHSSEDQNSTRINPTDLSSPGSRISGSSGGSDKKRAKNSHKISSSSTENSRAKSSSSHAADLENNYRSESSHDPISTSSGSPDQVEDLISEASVSPDNEKN